MLRNNLPINLNFFKASTVMDKFAEYLNSLFNYKKVFPSAISKTMLFKVDKFTK